MARKTVEKNIAFDDVRKLYYINLDYGKDESGKRIKKTVTASKLSEARVILKNHNADKTKNTLLIPKEDTVQDWLDYWYTNIVLNTCEETTAYGYNNIIKNHINPLLGDYKLQKLTPKIIQEYYNTKLGDEKKSLSPNTINKHHNLLKTALGVAVTQGLLQNNPVDRVIPPKKKNADISFYNSNQLKTLLDLVKDTRLELVVWIAGTTGLRRGEICGLKWDNVDLENNIININTTRTSIGSKVVKKGTKNYTSNRKIAFNDDLKELFIKEKNRQDENRLFLGSEYIESDYVIVMDNGKPYRPNYLSELFTNFVFDCGMPPITLHGLRHSVASVANEAGVSLYDLSKFLGHSTTNTTSKVYTHMFDVTHKKTADIISKALK